MQQRTLTIALTLIGAVLGRPAEAAQGLEAFAGVIGGAGIADIPAGCTTFGPPEPLLSFFGSGTGVSVPLGGISACNYSGGINDVVAVSGPLSTSRALAPVLLGNPGFAGTFEGSAQASAAFKTLRASARALIANGVVGSPLALHASTGASFFEDTLTASSPLIANLSAGFVRYRFELDGGLSTPGVPESFSPGLARAQLNIQHQGGSIYRIVEVDSSKGTPGSIVSFDPTNPGWTSGIGSISGSGTFFSTIHGTFNDIDLPMSWGQPFDVKVGLMVWAYGTGDADFFTTAQLTGVELFDAGHNEVTDFILSSASGVPYAPVPEPAALMIMGPGLIALIAWVRLRRGTLSRET